ncbi:hypothetical protein CSH63_00715 [Micromonospora tulbaghiae]|uniref:Integral membrane bound transporter domain-containing protein n=1 Tax=Micromonospora tulbaghiae TaxID=479978 RepID=A0A386WCA9_9ACTN|nr:hypothetical protein CSH63_00715 [Micromonospora tulbaghiae]
MQQLRIKSVLAVQAGLAAALAWAVARWLTGMPSPIFAPAAAVAVITSSFGRRLSNTVELLAGVTLGIIVSDLLIGAVGAGVWQTGVIVAASVLVALALSTRGGIVGNASGTAVLLGALSSSRHTLEFPRFVDALIGGGVGTGGDVAAGADQPAAGRAAGGSADAAAARRPARGDRCRAAATGPRPGRPGVEPVAGDRRGPGPVLGRLRRREGDGRPRPGALAETAFGPALPARRTGRGPGGLEHPRAGAAGRRADRGRGADPGEPARRRGGAQCGGERRTGGGSRGPGPGGRAPPRAARGGGGDARGAGRDRAVRHGDRGTGPDRRERHPPGDRDGPGGGAAAHPGGGRRAVVTRFSRPRGRGRAGACRAARRRARPRCASCLPAGTRP